MSGIDYDRWYMMDCFDSRDDAIADARRRIRNAREESGWVYRVKHRNSGRYCVERARKMSERELEHTRYYNRRIREDSNGQRRLF